MPRRPLHSRPKRSKALEVSKPKERSLEATVVELDLQARVVQLKIDGWSHAEIAQELKISKLEVPKLLTDGLAEYGEKRDKVVEKYFAIQTRRYDALLKKWMPRAQGYTTTSKDKDGNDVETYVPPDPKAATIVATVLRDSARMFGFNRIRVEHTGAHGGPILNYNAHIDWSRPTDEQLAQAAAGDPAAIGLLVGGTDSSGSPIGAAPSFEREGRKARRSH